MTHFHINAIDDQVEYKHYFTDQLKVFESNFNMIQLENDDLKCKIETLINPEQLMEYENENYLIKSIGSFSFREQKSTHAERFLKY